MNSALIEAMISTMMPHAQLSTAENGEEAVEAVQAGRFDLILMDVQMPKMDGIEATRRIRSIEQGSGVRSIIVALSAGAETEERARCMEAGMDEFLSKPLEKQALWEKVQKLVE